MGKITNIFCEDEVPQRLMGVLATFRTNIEKYRLKTRDLIDFTMEINGLSKPQMGFWHDYVRNKMVFQMEWQLMHKLGRIQMHPELFDERLIEEYGELEISQVSFDF